VRQWCQEHNVNVSSYYKWQQKLDYLMEQVGLAKKRQFGPSSEKMQEDLMGQLA